MTKLLAVLCLLLATEPAYALIAKGDVRIHEFEVDTPAGVRPLGQFVEIQKTARKSTLVRADDRLLPGARMRVRGYRDHASGELVPDLGVRGVTLIKSALTATPARTVEHLLVVPLSFVDLPAQRTAADIARDFERLPPWVARASYGHTTLVVDVHDTVRSNRPFFGMVCDFNAVIAEAVKLTDATVDYRNVGVINVILPAIDWQTTIGLCPSGGAGGAYIGRYAVSTNDGEVMLGQMATNEEWPASIHELGHTLGLNHANGLICGDETLPAKNFAGCTSREYGDPFDSMGQAFGDWSATRKAQLGWMAGPERIARLTAAGTYVIDALETPATPGTTSIKGLRVPLGAGSVIIESRKSAGNDAPYPFTWLQGVSLRADLEGYYLDAGRYLVGSNQTQALWPDAPSHQLDTATLKIGSAMTLGRWHVKVLAHDDSTGSATVRLADERCSDNQCFPACRACVAAAPGGQETCIEPFPPGWAPGMERLSWDTVPFCAELMAGVCWEECPASGYAYPNQATIEYYMTILRQVAQVLCPPTTQSGVCASIRAVLVWWDSVTAQPAP